MFTNLPLERNSYIKAIKIRIGLYNKKYKNSLEHKFISICQTYHDEVYMQYGDDDIASDLKNWINKKYFQNKPVIRLTQY